MKNIFLLLFISINIHLAFSQTNNCISKLDSNGVIKIAKKKNVYWTKAWQCLPKMNFDAETCEWHYTACKIEYTNRGDCKNTNGCTVTTRAILVINANTRKVIKLEKKKHVTHNYE